MTFPSGGGPVEVALATATETVPEPAALAGGVLYSIKIDGWRLVLAHATRGVRLWSRHGTDLMSRFPEIAEAALTSVPVGTVVDGVI